MNPKITDSPIRILLAEDNAINQRLAVCLLTKNGHFVEVANNGRETIALLGRGEFDLVLMDVQMPELNGFETTAEIRRRQTQGSFQIPIIAMTARAMNGDRDLCLQAGMDGYVAKPIQAQELFKEIERVLGRRQKEATTQCQEVTSVDGDSPDLPEQPSTHIPSPPVLNTLGANALDCTALMEGVGRNAKLLVELVEIFIKDSNKLLSDVRESIRQKDGQRLEQAAHRLRGAVGNFEVGEAYAASLSLEKMGKSGDLGEAEATYQRLESAIEGLTPKLLSVMEQCHEDTHS